MYSRSTGEVNSNRVTSSLLRKWTWLPTHAYEVRALTFEVTDNFGSNDVLPCRAYGPWACLDTVYHLDSLVVRRPPRERQSFVSWLLSWRSQFSRVYVQQDQKRHDPQHQDQRNGSRNRELPLSYPTTEDQMVWTSHKTANPTPSSTCI